MSRAGVLVLAALVGVLAGLAMVQAAGAPLELEPPTAITGARG